MSILYEFCRYGKGIKYVVGIYIYMNRKSSFRGNNKMARWWNNSMMVKGNANCIQRIKGQETLSKCFVKSLKAFHSAKHYWCVCSYVEQK